MEQIKAFIRDVPNFPKKGILFKDITPLLLEKEKFKACIDHFASIIPKDIDYVISIESRGFIFGSALAYAVGAGFVPIRKEGKLPYKKLQASYALEYGQAVMEIHADAMAGGKRAILMDDVLATGGTVEAAATLVSRLGVELLGAYFLIELQDLKGRQKLSGLPVHSLLVY
jgi:adenine phosphoribosyltransferase